MELSPEDKSGTLLLTPKGRVDQNSAAAFQEALLAQIVEAADKSVVIDMSGVDFMSSVGLRALMMAFKKSKAAGGKLFIAALTPVVKEVFQISRFDTVLSCHDDVEAALSAAS